jgi:hypothetical protein
MNQQRTISLLYEKLLSLYPRKVRMRFSESMLQTFNDLWNERQQSKKGFLSFALWTFIETAIGIFREYLLLISQGDNMRIMLKTTASSAFISLLLILPFIAMEIVNRRHYNEGFPFVLFFVLWLNLLAVSLILLPIMQGWQTANRDIVKPVPAQGNALLTSRKSTAIISITLFLIPVTLFFLTSIEWEPLSRLLTGPNPGQLYIPGQILVLGLISIPIAAGIIAGRPIVSTLRAGGSLFAHPIHLIIVVVISFLFAAGVVGLIIDQWPCFIGVQFCD